MRHVARHRVVTRCVEQHRGATHGARAPRAGGRTRRGLTAWTRVYWLAWGTKAASRSRQGCQPPSRAPRSSCIPVVTGAWSSVGQGRWEREGIRLAGPHEPGRRRPSPHGTSLDKREPGRPEPSPGPWRPSCGSLDHAAATAATMLERGRTSGRSRRSRARAARMPGTQGPEVALLRSEVGAHHPTDDRLQQILRRGTVRDAQAGSGARAVVGCHGRRR